MVGLNRRSLGARVRRSEDPRFLTGRGAYVDDVPLAGALHMAIWRSPLAHASLDSVDLTAARIAQGVIDAFDLSAFGPDPPTFPVVVTHESLKPCPQYPLVRQTARYVGEGVAVVVAESAPLAADALELIEVQLHPLDPLASVDTALSQGAPSLHSTAPGNVCARWTLRSGNVEAAFRDADLVVSERLGIQRHTGVPIEPRAVAAQVDTVSGELVIWVSGQWPHTTRSLAARMLDMPEELIRVVVPDVGGGFGVKEEFYPEDLLVPFAARRLGRAVKWIESRREHMMTVVHAREQVHDISMAFRHDGTLLGLRDRITTDMGAYVRALGIVNPSLAAASVPGPYRLADLEIESVAVLTNKGPVSAYRGAGQPEATFARERLFDIAAHRLGMDPAELRRRNLLPPDALPLDTGISSVDGAVKFDSGDFPKALETALRRLDYPHCRKPSSGALRGAGLAVYAQITGTGPFEGADIRVRSDGGVTLTTGAVDMGQGLSTALAQIVAETLEIDVGLVRVVCGDTGRIPHGVGTYASRAAVMAGNAAAAAATKVRDRATILAAHLFEVAPEDVEWRDGAARVRGIGGQQFTLGDLAERARPGGGHRPADLEPALEARHYFESEAPPYAYGVHAVVVDVDRETGLIRVVRYVVVNDSGVLINPMIAEGQIVGGVAQGLGGALLEWLAYDDRGQLVTSSLLDYAVPRAADIPTIEMEHLQIPTPLNPLGVKGLGEGGAVGAHAAVANAVADALRTLDISVLQTPLTANAIAQLIRERGSIS